MTWRDELEKEIATAEDATRAAESRRAAAAALEPRLRAEAKHLLLESVEVLRRHGVAPVRVFTRHEGQHPKPKRLAGYPLDEGIFVEVVSSMLRERRPIYVDPAAPRSDAWSTLGLSGSSSDTVITEDGQLRKGHRLRIGRYSPRGGERIGVNDSTSWALCICDDKDHLRFCSGDGHPAHSPHLELDRHSEDRPMHGEPIPTWLKDVVTRLATRPR
ncbi:MAG: hypothetical protein ACRCYU_01850 [Nocardioides sp.]